MVMVASMWRVIGNAALGTCGKHRWRGSKLSIMPSLEDSLFRLKMTSKQLKKQSIRAKKEVDAEKKKIKKAIQDGNDDIARLHAQNATRKQAESVNMLRLASRVESVASRVQTAVTMRQLTGSMGVVVKGMDGALESMRPERISLVMDKFEQQFEDLDASTKYYESASGSAAAIDTPQEEVDLLLQQVADDAGLELKHDLASQSAPQRQVAPQEQIEDRLDERLRALRG